MKLKTSSLIARKFTGYVSGLLLLLGIFLNLMFFVSWYRGENIKLQAWLLPRPLINTLHKKIEKKLNNQNRLPFIPLFENIRSLALDQNTLDELKEWKIIRNISYIDENYVMYSANISKNEIKFIHVNEQINAQVRLLRISWMFILLFAFITYLLSQAFVKWSFYRVNELLSYVKWLNIHNLDTKVPQLWPSDDEIQIIGNKLQESLDTIKSQTDSLKHFISYASHELKTPLMSISALLDVGEKTGKYDLIKDKIKGSVLTMNNLIEQLLSQLKEQKENSSEYNECNISDVLMEVVNEIKLLYPDHRLQLAKTNPHYIAHIPKQQFVTILHNILQNACKYSSPWTSVTININNNKISIKDEGLGIEKSSQDKIRNEFYRVNQQKDGHGLWLSIVKKISDQYGWKIEVKSEAGIWSEFIIHYK